MIIDNTQELIDLIPDLIFYKNLKGQYTNCNKSFLHFIERTKEEVIGQTDHELFSKLNADAFRAVDLDIIQNGEERTFEESFHFENGAKAYFSTTKQVLYDAHNKKVGLFCIARNITTQKEYELIYKDNQLLLEYIATQNSLKKIFKKIIHLSQERNEKTKCSILLLDESGKYLHEGVAPDLPNFYNEAIEGIEIGENIGSCGSAAFSKQRVIVSNINEHKNWQPYLELTQKANLHACWSEPIISSNNKVLGTFAIYSEHPNEPTDFELKHISSFAHLASVAIEKDKILKLIKEKNSLLMNKSRIASIGEMLENISHHWRQPLSIISTEASGIKLKDEFEQLDKKSLNNSIDNIIEYTQQLSETLDDFRKYSITNTDKEWFFIDSAIEKAIFILQSTLENHEISIVKQLQKVEHFALENAFIHSILNLLKNACDAMGDQHHLIFIECSVHAENIQIKIKDSGEGIDTKIIDKIFDPYFTTKHQSFGTGSGLYICKEIIELQMNGSIHVQNVTFEHEGDQYKGAEFTLTLPL